MPYSPHHYGVMIGDSVRVEAYARALGKAIHPGAVVLDLGAGTGIFSLLACRLGARHVHACDTNPALQVARELARHNGLTDRITFHQCASEKLELPEPADVIVADLRGRLPLHGRSLPTLVDARKRHLKPGGILLPQRDRLWVALAEAPDQYQQAIAPWKQNDLGLDLTAWSSLLANRWNAAEVRASELVSSGELWAEIDYRTLESPDVRRRVTCVASRAATVHGFFLWFDAELLEGIGLSGGPDTPKMIYGAALFPWPRPIEVAPGDEAELAIEAVLVGDDYVWTWNSSVRPRAGGAPTRFAQSTFLGACLSPEALRRRSAEHVPSLNQEGQLTLWILGELARRRPLGEIADQLLRDFPARFQNRAESLGFVGRLCSEFSD